MNLFCATCLPQDLPPAGMHTVALAVQDSQETRCVVKMKGTVRAPKTPLSAL